MEERKLIQTYIQGLLDLLEENRTAREKALAEKKELLESHHRMTKRIVDRKKDFHTKMADQLGKLYDIENTNLKKLDHFKNEYVKADTEDKRATILDKASERSGTSRFLNWLERTFTKKQEKRREILSVYFKEAKVLYDDVATAFNPTLAKNKQDSDNVEYTIYTLKLEKAKIKEEIRSLEHTAISRSPLSKADDKTPKNR